MRKVVLVLLLAVTVTSSAFGHGGGLDRNGCHTNRKTGNYHCHGGASFDRAPAPAPAPSRGTSSSPKPRTQLASMQVTEPAPVSSGRDLLVRTAQVLLQDLGYKPTLLGKLDVKTQAAVKAFQRAEKLNPDGRVTDVLLVRLAERVSAKCP